MTMIILVMIFLSNPVECLGQDIVNLNHIVQCGETIESLADKYRLTTDILKTANFGMDVFYTGLEVFIPVDKKYLRLRSVEDGEKILNDIAGYFTEYQEASRIFNSGDYKKRRNCLFLQYGITENICHVKKRILAKPCVITTAKNGTLPLRDSHKSLT